MSRTVPRHNVYRLRHTTSCRRHHVHQLGRLDLELRVPNYPGPHLSRACYCRGYGRLFSGHSLEDRVHLYHDTTAHATTWPPYGQIVPEEEDIDEPEPDDDGVHVPCTAWFFFFCISWGNTHVRSWYWILPPGIYGPGPPPIGIIRPPPGVTIRGNLPNWPRITIGPDHRLTTESEPECETQTAEACTTTDYVSDGTTTSSTTLCETITGCSISVSDSSTVVVGSQTAAPVGTWYGELWATMTLGDAYTNSVYAAVESRLAREEASGSGTTISFTPGPTAGPTCKGLSTACGGTLFSGYWCDPTPTGFPPGFQDPKDPSSDGYSASTTTIGGSTTTKPPTSTPPTSTTPLTRGPINCFDEADFPGHADIQPGDQDDSSRKFSDKEGDTDDDTIGPGDPAFTLHSVDSHGANYDYSCRWVDGCVTEVERQDFGFPLGVNSGSLITAYLLVREDYTKCNNGGVGGSCQVGCLLYTFEGARGSDPCEDFDCQQCGAPGEVPECQECCGF
ncbi:hypothetical protein ANO14919_022240 [Xylariales sp. No.14919]|nr:hypothetical protein ANO14919_022240 [Xylariales sp. No.14919]